MACRRKAFRRDAKLSEVQLSPWPIYAQDEIDAATAVLRSGRVNYWTGDEGKNFEAEFAQFCQSKFAIAVANGTVALELAFEALGIGPGDDVIVTPRTFIASASSFVRLGARPVFADVSLDSQNITPESVKAALTPSTRAIVAVHHAGWPCEMEGLMALAEENNLLVIEDCAQAHGASIDGRPVGSFGHASAFSFCQDKIMTTGGEGGMLVTNDEAVWKHAWAIKDHGKSHDAVYNREHAPGFRWLHESFGTNMRLTETQSAIGRIQLRKLSEWSARRTDNAHQIAASLEAFPSIRVPMPTTDVVHAYYRLYAFVVPEYLAAGWGRERIVDEISKLGIPCREGSCPEIYREKAFDNDQFGPTERLENACLLGSTGLSFLVHPSLTPEDIAITCDAMGKVLSKATKS